VSARCLEQAKNLAGLRVTPDPGLLEDGHPVAKYFEAATGRRDQLDRCTGVTRPNLRRQTGGAGFVVSNRAVLDRDVHRSIIR
jgi:hypothetical protein